ncbi:MAG: hypothetical protein DRO36_05195 [Candidatus Hecatellales archaeon]|nr:MAG: hypothetical protein DRO36_05195 [Candidatus Hecatellales archaeon]
MVDLNDVDYYWDIVVKNFDLYIQETQEEMLIELIHVYLKSNEGVTLEKLKELVTRAMTTFMMKKLAKGKK